VGYHARPGLSKNTHRHGSSQYGLAQKTPLGNILVACLSVLGDYAGDLESSDGLDGNHVGMLSLGVSVSHRGVLCCEVR
jgi:hypothetical protein